MPLARPASAIVEDAEVAPSREIAIWKRRMGTACVRGEERGGADCDDALKALATEADGKDGWRFSTASEMILSTASVCAIPLSLPLLYTKDFISSAAAVFASPALTIEEVS